MTDSALVLLQGRGPVELSGIRWALSPLTDARQYALVSVDVVAFDRAYAAADWQGEWRIPPGGMRNTIGDRYQRFQAFLRDTDNGRVRPIEPPFANLRTAPDGVDLSDGRHRFAVIRDAGHARIALQVPRGEVRRMAAMLERFRGDTIERLPAVARRTGSPAKVEGGRHHFAEQETRAAGRALGEVLAGRGQPLGTGNFGAAFRVDLEVSPFGGAGPVVVKLGSRRTIHTRSPGEMYHWVNKVWSQGGRSLATAKEELRHEAGVSNELWERGHRVVPRSVYVEHAGRPAIVREWGEIPAHVSREEYDALGEALAAVVEDGWKVLDDLLVARRPDGSLFVADVGIWRPLRTGDEYDTRDAWMDLTWLLGKLSQEQPWSGGEPVPSTAQIRRGEVRIVEFEAEAADEEAEGEVSDAMARFHRKRIERERTHLAKLRARREAVGMPAPSRPDKVEKMEAAVDPMTVLHGELARYMQSELDSAPQWQPRGLTPRSFVDILGPRVGGLSIRTARRMVWDLRPDALNRDRLTILRLGLGKDSMTMLALLGMGELIVDGRPRGPDEIDAVVFTDPGHEWEFTYALLPRVQAFCDYHGLRFLAQRKPPAEGPEGWIAWIEHQVAVREAARAAGKASAPFGAPFWRRNPPATIEERCASGYYHQRAPLFEDYGSKDAWIAKDDSSCTVNHKIVPNREMLVDLQVERFGRLPPVPGTLKKLDWVKQAEAWAAGGHRPHLMLIGYAADEQERLSEVKGPREIEGFEDEAYPLMAMEITKEGEQGYLDTLPGVDPSGVLRPGGFSDVKKSGCKACKEQDVAQFWMLRKLDPAFFEQIVRHEQRVVARTGPWQAIFPRRLVAVSQRRGAGDGENPLLAPLRAEGRLIGTRIEKGREYAYPFFPLAEKVQSWLDNYVKTHGREPDVEEVARKEYRACSVASSLT